VVPSTFVRVSNQSFCKATSIDFKLKLFCESVLILGNAT
jgi:hypothetical protein